MKTATAILVLLILVLAAVDLMASGPVGIYGIVEKVMFEPNQNSPARIQVWGACALRAGGVDRSGRISPTPRGYLYFPLPSGHTLAAPVRAEWSDLKAIAG